MSETEGERENEERKQKCFDWVYKKYKVQGLKERDGFGNTGCDSHGFDVFLGLKKSCSNSQIGTEGARTY